MLERRRLHQPVLLDEVTAILAPLPGGRYVDGTIGLGGHAERILEGSAPDGFLLGLDRDSTALALAADRLARFGTRVRLVHANYVHAFEQAREAGVAPCDGLLLDLGVSSLQLEDAGRGFSFRLEAPLDMRFDQESGDDTAADIVNETPEEELADILWRLGEETASRRIARAIVRARPLRTTTELAGVVARVAGRPGQRTSPATRTFQALRIAVNHELDALRQVLDSAGTLLRSGGRLAVISFHSLEDRIVKQFIQRESRDCLCPPGLPECRCGHSRTFAALTRGAVTPAAEERARNPRSRSAKLRAAVRV